MNNRDSGFSDKGFWKKMFASAAAAGKEVLEKVLWLWYALQKPDTPAWAKATITGALAYFIAPLDAIPDFAPGIGYADDAAVLATAVAVVAAFIDEDVKNKAKKKLDDWLG